MTNKSLVLLLLGWISLLLLPSEHCVEANAEIEAAGEYCMFDTFEAHCDEGSVIQMNSAVFGRMRLGKCVQTDLGFIGCSVDVLDRFDKECSGKNRCSMMVQMLFDLEPCPADLTSYLEASYSCLPVVVPRYPSPCTSGTYTLTESEGNIASLITGETGFGSEDCPYVIQANHGQEISLSLLDFDAGTGEKAYAEIDVGFSSMVMHGGSEREGEPPIVLSQPVVQVTVLAGDSNFILKYSVQGCPDLSLHEDETVERDGDRLEVTCARSGHVSSLTCDRTTREWIGDREDCSAGCPAWEEPEGYKLERYGSKLVLTCEVTGKFVLLKCEGTRWIQKYPIEDETEISFPPCP